MTDIHTTPYNRNAPFLASIKDRYTLCKEGSQKNTMHVVLDIKGSGILYNVGDSVGIYPKNDPMLVQKTLEAMHAVGDEVIMDKHAEHSWNLRDFLTIKGNITEVSRKLLAEIGFRQSNETKKTFINSLFAEGNRDTLKSHLEDRHLWDILNENPEVSFPPQELCNLLMPLLPRLYSIASSQKLFPDEIHLTVALLEYHSNGHYRRGVCTHYLCELAPLQQSILPIYIQPHHGFTTPENINTSMIMIGPGTGVAPFRAFMQERQFQGSSGKNWLFFGERHRSTEFFYEDDWTWWVKGQSLRLSLAFSRDQDQKIYVQHRIVEEGADFYKWIEQGASIYVCGDANHMAKDVEEAILQVIQQHGGLDIVQAKQFLKQLRADKRYLRDIY